MPFIVACTILVMGIFMVDNLRLYRIFYVALSLLLLTLIYNTFIIYTADFEFSPWHNSGKVAYLVVVIEVLWLLAINAIMALLSRKISISPDQLALPFIAAVILGIYLIFYTNPPKWLCICGAAASVILFFSSLTLFFINFFKNLKEK